MRISPVFGLSFVALCVWLEPAWAADAAPRDHATYEVIMGGQYGLCKTLAENFNKFPATESMACERRFHSDFPQLVEPQWSALSSEDALRAALKLPKQLLEYVSWDDYQRKYALADELFRKEIQTRKLRAWEARFDLARSGTKVRVIRVTRSRCKPEDNYQSFEPVIGVLQEQQFELDERFELLLLHRGDIFFYEGLTYFHNWSVYPSAVGRSTGPKKRHHGYVLVYDLYWLKPGFGARHGGGTATLSNLVCQIGYRRLPP